ncbi:hypothetical protein KOR34_49720 [Posidoniimonas corsicana]|uniref:Uncharacterized protein n=1 Tax=Posidoniimonas corsicana TaxID=1938618 RepID=A0A5C5UXP2_9BACT|nr:hypothetical protein [Posidoniimonas corsicana]TWT30413.1 hypothetical protein KOR34_49720 [Posidoniimonas corsicana]
MRLTLRTLLAYLDNILEPQDQEELSRRVAASDVANDLLHRTRDATRRLRQPAPDVNASGPQSDANTVAEYLDNTLPPDDVTEFERRCLDLETFPDADSHLAETALCHHVLTMVLGQRADIDPATKQRLYAMGRGAAAATAAPPAEPQEVGPPVHEHSSVAEIPDYLRASERSVVSRLLPAIAALLLLAVTAFLAFGPGGWMREKGEPVAANNGAASPAEAGAASPEEGEPAPIVPPIDEPQTGGDTPGGVADGEPEDEPSGDPDEVISEETVVEVEEPIDPAAGVPGVGVVDEGMADEASGETATVSEQGPDPLEGVDPPIPGVPTAPGEALADAPTGEGGEEAMTTDPAEAVASDDSSEEGADPLEPVEPEPPKRLGMVFSQGAVLLRLDEATDQPVWRRVADRAEVMPGEKLLSLPTYRPAVAFDSEIVLDLFDGTRVNVGSLGESTPEVNVVYGRLLLTNMGKTPAELSFSLGERFGRLTLGEASSLAIEVERLFQPGVDPRQQAAPLVAECYAPVGDVEWAGADFEINAADRGMWMISDQEVSEIQPYSTDPTWLEDRTPSRVTREASPRLAAQIQVGPPAWTQLSAINNSRLKEVRALANICAVHIGQFDAIVKALRDEEQSLSWSEEIAALRFAMASSPALAQAVNDELYRQRPEEVAEEVWEMLCGYNLQQVGEDPDAWRVGAMRTLIDRLSSDQLDVRVLANTNLEQITGRRGVFNPIGTSGARETSINRQRSRLESGELKPAGLTSAAP